MTTPSSSDTLPIAAPAAATPAKRTKTQQLDDEFMEVSQFWLHEADAVHRAAVKRFGGPDGIADELIEIAEGAKKEGQWGVAAGIMRKLLDASRDMAKTAPQNQKPLDLDELMEARERLHKRIKQELREEMLLENATIDTTAEHEVSS